MSFGIFESAVGSEVEVAIQKQASVDKFAAAVYDVRQKLGSTLFAARNVDEFRHMVAMMKNDQSIFRVIEAAGLHPSTGVVRRIVGKNSILEGELRRRLADSGGGAGASMTAPEPAQTMPQPSGDYAPQNGMTAASRTACYPGCDKNEAHAKKFHKDKAEKESKRTAVYDTIDHPKWDNGTVDLDEGRDTHPGKELKPKGDFKGYLNKVDQDAPGKISRDFDGDGTRHQEDPAKHCFASKEAQLIYLDWCKSNDLSPIRLSSLNVYAEHLPQRQYFALANTIAKWENDHKPKVPATKLPKKDKVAGAHDLKSPIGVHWTRQQTSPYTGKQPQNSDEAATLRDIDPGRSLRAEPAWPAPPPPGGKHRAEANKHIYAQHYLAWCRKNRLAEADATNLRAYGRSTARMCPEGFQYVAKSLREVTARAKARFAGTDYLQKADDALTQLLNQKAEEFQETIAPLQQALVTVQQAAQLQQAQNPLNVLPPPGTVNVLPGGQPGAAPGSAPLPGAGPAGAPSTAEQVGMPDPNQPDLSGLASMLQPGGGAMGGVAPQEDQGQSAPPPAAQQATARKRSPKKARGAARPHVATGVGEQWDQWKARRPGAGDTDYDYEQFQNEVGVGERAMNNLRTRNQSKPAWGPINQSGPEKAQGLTVGRRRRAETYHGDGDVEKKSGPFAGPHGSFPVGTPKDLNDAKDVCNEPSVRGKHPGTCDKVEHMQKPAHRKQAWSGWGPAQVPKTRHVAGWDWDDYQNGYLASRPQDFSCHCGSTFPAPSGFHRCACGSQWNSYLISNAGGPKEASADQFLVREIPVRHDVIVANRRMVASKKANQELLACGDAIDARPEGERPQAIEVKTVKMVDPKTGKLHSLIDPGMDEGEDPKHPTFRKQPADWAKRNKGGQWTPKAVG